MNIQKVGFSNQNFGAGVNITRVSNADKKFLYNDVSDLVSEHKIPALFTNDGIILPRATEKVIKKLNSMNIKYSEFKD